MKKVIIGIIILMGLIVSAFGADKCKQTKAGGHYTDPYPGVETRQFIPLPVGAVKPEGWIKKSLQAWADGITGHLHEYMPDFYWKTWDDRRHRNEHPYMPEQGWSYFPFEEQPYWADALVQLAYVLDDERLKAVADEFIDKVLAGQNPDGYIGCTPDEPYKSDADIYGLSELTLSLMAYHSATNDPRIVPAMQRGFRHIYENCRPLAHAEKGRAYNHAWEGTGWPYSCHIMEAVVWVYSKTGDQMMLDLANAMYEAMQKVPSDFQTRNLLLNGDTIRDNHGVDVGETLRVPAIYYLYSGNKDALDASIKGLEAVDRYHGQVHGGPATDEHMRYPSTVANTEHCALVVLGYTKQVMFSITGDARYADAVEKITFNIGPGSRKPDGKAIQYLSAPNQAACTKTSCRSPVGAGVLKLPTRQLFLPDGDPEVPCCVGESNRLYPNYVRAMWLASPDNGLAAACYGPCAVSAKVGQAGTTVTIEEKTGYPFEEKISFVLKSSKSVKFPLYLRIPGWCEQASIEINDKSYTDSVLPDKMVRIDRLWSSGDRVTLNLPMKIRLSRGDKGSVAVERGPLVYSLKIKQNWKKIGERFEGFPDWQCTPGSDWNYALCLDYAKNKVHYRDLEGFAIIRRDPPADYYFTVKHLEVPKDSYPWQYSPIELVCKGTKIDGWKLLDSDVTPEVPQSPVVSDNPMEDITLIPFGCAPIRITYFPITGRDVH